MKTFIIASSCFLAASFTAISAEREVKVENTRAGITLAGTLAAPDNITAPRGSIVLVTGSGPQNRDEEIFGLRPFKVISDSLVSAGFAVLRMDDRGVGESGGDYESALTDDFADDARAGIEFMQGFYPDSPVGIVGHSLGGSIAIKLAAKNIPDFIVTMAAPAWPGDSLIMEQCRINATAQTGRWDGEATERELLGIAKSSMPAVFAQNAIYAVLARELGEDIVSLPAVQNQLNAAASQVISPFYRDMLRYDPKDDIMAVKIPWIAMNGEKDTQVPVKSLETIRTINPGAITIAVPGHNHLFQEANTGLVSEYALSGVSPTPETISLLIDALNMVITKTNAE